MTKEKIAAIKAKRLAKKKTTIRVDDELEPDLLVKNVCYFVNDILKNTECFNFGHITKWSWHRIFDKINDPFSLYVETT